MKHPTVKVDPKYCAECWIKSTRIDHAHICHRKVGHKVKHRCLCGASLDSKESA